MQDLTHPEGSVFVQVDWRMSELVRLVLDEVFGKGWENEEVG